MFCNFGKTLKSKIMFSVNSEDGNQFNIVAVVVLIIAVIGVFAAPYFLSQPASFTSFDFSEKGNIGSYIGGTTAPIIGLVSAFLVYIAFRAQYLANKKQWKIIDEQQRERDNDKKVELLWALLSDVKTDFREKEMESWLIKIKQHGHTVIDSQKLVHKLDSILYDIILFQYIMLENGEIPTIQCKALKYKTDGITRLIFKTYDLISQDQYSSNSLYYYEKAKENNEKIATQFNI